MRNVRRMATVVGTAGAATMLAVGVAHATPWYNQQGQQSTLNRCINTTQGGSSGRNGGEFIATTFDGAFGCTDAYVELIYVDNNGNEQARYAHNSYNSNGWFATIELSNSQYQSILEVVGSSTAIGGSQTPGVYLFF